MDSETLCRTIQRAFALLGLSESRIDAFAERSAYLTLLERLAPDAWLEAEERSADPTPDECDRNACDAQLLAGGTMADHVAVGPWEPYAVVPPEDRDASGNPVGGSIRHYRRPLRKKS